MSSDKERVEILPNEDLNEILAARTKAVLATQTAQRYIAEAKLADAEHRNTVMAIFMKHGMTQDCSVDEVSGYVTWPENRKDEG